MEKIGNEYYKTQSTLGEKAELDFAEYLEEDESVTNIEVTKGYFPEYDISAIIGNSTLPTTWEIKYNSEVGKYKHVFVECYQSGKPSGMQVTTADYQVHYSEFGEVRGLLTIELAMLIAKKNRKLVPTKYSYNGKIVSALGYTVRFDDLKAITKNRSI